MKKGIGASRKMQSEPLSPEISQVRGPELLSLVVPTAAMEPEPLLLVVPPTTNPGLSWLAICLTTNPGLSWLAICQETRVLLLSIDHHVKVVFEQHWMYPLIARKQRKNRTQNRRSG
jgi:hypothetical protein